MLRTVEDLEAWLAEVSEEVDASLLQQSTRNIIALLKDSRTAAIPTTFPHKGGNPLRPAMAFEEVLLQEGSSYVGRLVRNLYRNKHCAQLARELLGACVGGSEQQLQQVDQHVSALCRMEHLDEPLVNILCQAIQTLQQRARLGRLQIEASNLQDAIVQKRAQLTEQASECSADDAQAMTAHVDDTLELLLEQKTKVLPMQLEASTCFLMDGSQFEQLRQATTAHHASLADQRGVLNASLETAKAQLKEARRQRRERQQRVDCEDELSPRKEEHSLAFLDRMKSVEEALMSESSRFEEQIKEAIATMGELATEQKQLDAKDAACTQLLSFVEAVEAVHSQCFAAELEAAREKRRDLIMNYGEDVKRLCEMLSEAHLVFHCKRVSTFKQRFAPKKAELQKLNALCLNDGERALNSALEQEVTECGRLIDQSLERVEACKQSVVEHITEYLRLAAADPPSPAPAEGAGAGTAGAGAGAGGTRALRSVPPPPTSIEGAQEGSFFATSKGGEQVRVTVNAYGLTLHKHQQITTFYDYRSIRSWDMSDEHFGITPSSQAKHTGQSERPFKLATDEGRSIAAMLNQNALLLVTQSQQDKVQELEAELLRRRQAILDFCSLVQAYGTDDPAVRYEGGRKDGIPHGEGKLILSATESYQGEFRDGQPSGRGLFRRGGFSYEGEFLGLRPVGRSHLYVASKKVDGLTTDLYQGQLNYDFSFHGSGRLKTSSAVRGMEVHYEGAFQNGTPHSRYSRLWMAPSNARRRLTTADVAIFLGGVERGVPYGPAQLYLPAPRRSQEMQRTIYRGTFDGCSYLNYGKPAGSGQIAYTNGNVYQGPIMEAEGSTFMPVPMAGELEIKTVHSGIETLCVYRGEFDHLGRPQGTGKLERTSDSRVIHEGSFKDGEPETGWSKWLFG